MNLSIDFHYYMWYCTRSLAILCIQDLEISSEYSNWFHKELTEILQWTSNSEFLQKKEGRKGRHDRYFNESRNVPRGGSIFTLFMSLFSSECLTAWIKQWILWYVFPSLTAQQYQSWIFLQDCSWEASTANFYQYIFSKTLGTASDVPSCLDTVHHFQV